MATSQFVDNGGVRIHYLDSGGADRGAPIVFVPGMTDVAADYTEVLPTLGRRTVVIETRGHGDSAAPRDGYDLDQLSGDVGAVVDDVTAGAVHLMTFSRGTSAAIHWALEHPDRIRSVAIGDYLPAELVPPEGAAEALMESSWRGTPVTERLDGHAATETIAAARSRPFWEPLAALGVPLLVVRSTESPLVSDEHWARYRTTFPSAELVDFDGSPHDIFRPDRHRYPRLVREHVERADRSGR